jgi:NDP-sugar pyrophosphorylase family protein
MIKKPLVIIPMSGKGTRFITAGYSELKPFILVNGKPIIEHVIDQYPDNFDFLAILSSEDLNLNTHIEQLRKIKSGIQIAIIDPHKLGPGHAISQAADSIKSNVPIIVNYCDFAGKWEPQLFIQKLEKFDCNILTYSGFHPHMARSTKFAYAKMNDDVVAEVREKQPFTEDPMSEEASAGIYGFKDKDTLIRALNQQIEGKLETNGEFYISLTCQAIIENSGSATITRMEKFFQWGTPEDLEDWVYWSNFFEKIKTKRKFNPIPDHGSGSVLILAGGQGSRLARMVVAPKPLLQVEGKSLWEHSLLCSRATIVIREDLGEALDSSHNVNIVKVSNSNGGQAESALTGLKSMSFTGPVSVMASDNIVLDVDLASLHSTIDSASIYVWVCEKYPAAMHNPQQFSWISVSKDRKVQDFYAKSKPNVNSNYMNLIGNFTFPSKEVAVSLITELKKRGIQINEEYYLDSVISIAKDFNLEVKILETKEYFSIGTESELKTFLYWDPDGIPGTELQVYE